MKKILIIFILVFLNCKAPEVEQKPQKPNILLFFSNFYFSTQY